MVFEVVAVDPNFREWSPKANPERVFHAYRIRLDGGGEVTEADWSRKPSSDPPKVGDRVAGSLEPGQYRPKFKFDAEGTRNARLQDRAELFQGGESRDDRQASIIRQHSQEMALRYCEIQGKRGKLPEDFDTGHVFKLTDVFDRDATR